MEISEISLKWGAEVAERGFSQVPNFLMNINQFLDEEERLKPIELLILLQITSAWWKRDDFPFPSMATLGKRVGASERQVQRVIKKLEEAGYLKKIKRKRHGIIASNAYDLSPLVDRLKLIAKAFPTERPRQLK